MTLHPALVFLAGLVVVILGAEMMLRGASRIAAMLGVRPIVIGLTVVAVGTSAPELAVGIVAVAEGRGPLAVGNVAGTNMFNILFILGLSAALRPLPVHRRSVELDVRAMIAAAIALLVMALDGAISRIEGAALLLGAVVYMTLIVRSSGSESSETKREFSQEYSKKALHVRSSFPYVGWSSILFLVGMGLTLLGADLLVVGAVEIARSLGVSDAVIGLTIVAVGTSAPELATTVVATLKDDRDVAVGNLIGSSTSNILLILGVTCVVAPNGVDVSPDVLWIDLPLAAIVAVACLPVFRSDAMVSRREGLAFLAAYLVYLAALLIART